jgi:hypothetical protein
MRLTIANISKTIAAADFEEVGEAIIRQVSEHFDPEWNVRATLRMVPYDITAPQTIDGLQDAILYLGDSSQDPTTGVDGLLGYHSKTHGNIPYGFVYLDVCAEYGSAWPTCLSHETLELLADPTAALTVTGPAPAGHTGHVYYDLEVCDPTQGDSYRIDDVEVSNFVCRSYFGLAGGSGQTNFQQLPLEPFGVRPGGYLQFEDGGRAFQLKGDKVTDQHLAARAKMKLGRRNTRRAARLTSK